MIYGNGVDNVELARIQEAMKRSERFSQQVLTENELIKFSKFQSEKRKVEYLAGRWAAKEAFAKAYGTGFGSQLKMHDLEVQNDELGKPFFSMHPFDKGQAHLSISHSNLEAVAFVVLEND
ncbi:MULTISPECIES: holo-ACP synthase [unclassified Lactococcus]|uniref:holo-ACP synthase n=1 Tax=unclassified Lactococcus TaxID=2643510 RepID=UPI0011CB6987|nr:MULTISPECIES: holo-ACP synthase [unclassified Lactococcus]MQW22220.1 holo-ACP synthase [Lactococcus sp. dk101]TXK45152.1 holo-ACP synthase [Lactococcus sp. dk310]TXK51068.1 holo-ACP synthase [Lactococcus sp. dk322]